MNYINTNTNQYPVTERQIRAEYPLRAHPNPFSPPSEFKPVFPTPQPEHNPVIQIVVEGNPVYSSKGQFEQTWNIQSKFQEYTDDEGIVHTVEEQEQAALAQHAQEQAIQLQNSVVQAVQVRLDTFVQTKNYDGILSAASYATSTNPTFAAEGQRAVILRDNTWATLYQILADVQAGNRPIPSGYEEIEPELPVLTW